MLIFMNELAAAGITDPDLMAAFAACRKLNAEHGKTYFLATRLLPKAKRPFVHALYGFARYADEIVDDLNLPISNQARTEKFESWQAQVRKDLHRGKSEDPIVKALLYTITRFDLDLDYFESFLNSMNMDLTIKTYNTFEDLMKYVYGSASVIGLQMVPILGTSNIVEANIAAEKLGTAFQLANFIRDIGEDLNRGRIYLPLEELAEYGVSEEELRERVVTPEIRKALAFQIERVRRLQREANVGIRYLSEVSRPCIEAASELYCGIVDEVEKIDYQIFTLRAKTSKIRRAKVAIPALWRAVRARN